MRNEWSYFSDAFIKVFFDKISHFDAITNAMQKMLHMLLTDNYYDVGACVLIELGATGC